MNSGGDILIVDDEAGIRLALRHSLIALGFHVDETVSGEQALIRARGRRYDVAFLDVNMPGIGGLETCRTMRREFPSLGIVMLTVQGDVDNKVEALEAGADDYITKPFSIKELIARLGAVRRGREGGRRAQTSITIGDISLDSERHLVTRRGTSLHLTPKEFELLEFFMQNAGKPTPHQTVLQTIWGPDYGGELEYLRTFVHQLRKKIEDTPSQPRYLTTEGNVGYRFWSPA